jgi:hypothetical protein
MVASVATAPAASADVVGPFTYVGFEGVVQRPGSTSAVTLFDDGGALGLTIHGSSGTTVTDVGFDAGYGWWTGAAAPSVMAEPLTDEGVAVGSDYGDRGIFAYSLGPQLQEIWQSGVAGKALAHSHPFVLGRDRSGAVLLLAVGSPITRAVAPGARLVEDLLVEPRTEGGATTLWAQPLAVDGDLLSDGEEAFPLTSFPACADLQFIVNDSGWLVRRCGSGPVLARDLLAEAEEDVPLRLSSPPADLDDDDRPQVRLADGWLVRIVDGELLLADLTTGEEEAVLRVAGWAETSFQVSVPRSGWALAAVPEDGDGETVLLTLSDGFRAEDDTDPFEAWYAARTKPPVGPPASRAPGQTELGSRLQAGNGALYAWRDGPNRRAHEVRGLIEQEYDRLGGPDGSFLGYPVTDESRSADRVGAYNHFQRGSIFFSPRTGAHEIRGLVRATWIQKGAEIGVLGYPRTHEMRSTTGAAYSLFERGAVYFSAGTGAHEVHGEIGRRYLELGTDVNPLGLPVSDELLTPGGTGAANHFQRGSIYWSPRTGARFVRGLIRDKWFSARAEQTLGFPVTDETCASVVQGPASRCEGARSMFERGSIYWSPQTGAAIVRGLIRDRYELGMVGVLGFPVADEAPTPFRPGAYSHFQHGSIYFSPQTGAVSVRGAVRDHWARSGWENGWLGFPAREPVQSGDVVSQRFQGGTVSWNTRTGAVTATR